MSGKSFSNNTYVSLSCNFSTSGNANLTSFITCIFFSYPEKYAGCDVRIRMGKFYTDEEIEQIKETELDMTLACEKEKKCKKKGTHKVKIKFKGRFKGTLYATYEIIKSTASLYETMF